MNILDFQQSGMMKMMRTVQAHFWPKTLLNFVLNLKNGPKIDETVKLMDLLVFGDFRLILLLSRQNLTTF